MCNEREDKFHDEMDMEKEANEMEDLPVKAKSARKCSKAMVIGVVVLVVIVVVGVSVGIWQALEDDDDDDDDVYFPTYPPTWGWVDFQITSVNKTITIPTNNLPSTQCQPCWLRCQSQSECKWDCIGSSHTADSSLFSLIKEPFYSPVHCHCDSSSWKCVKQNQVTYIESNNDIYFRDFLNTGHCNVSDCVYLGSQGLDTNWMCTFGRNVSAAVMKSDNQTAFDELVQLLGDGVGTVVTCSEAVAGRAYYSAENSLRSPLSSECPISDGWVGTITNPTHRVNVSSETAHTAASNWLNAAQDEHASVASFSKFSIQLLAVGAPSHLVELSHRAALQEVQHARLCFKSAALIKGRESDVVGPGKFPPHSIDISSDLSDVAVSTAKEGAIGETNAALVAAVRHELFKRSEAVRDAESELSVHITDTLQQVMIEEAEHAALAWKTLRWAKVDVDFLALSSHSSASSEADVIDTSSSLLSQFGVLSSAETNILSSEIFERVTLPLSRQMQSGGSTLSVDIEGSTLIQYGGDSVRQTLSHLLKSIDEL